jgi:hypothetical protein
LIALASFEQLLSFNQKVITRPVVGFARIPAASPNPEWDFSENGTGSDQDDRCLSRFRAPGACPVFVIQGAVCRMPTRQNSLRIRNSGESHYIQSDREM